MTKVPILIARSIGVCLAICAIVLMLINPQPENNLPEGFFTPIIAFEFIQTPAEVVQFFQVSLCQYFIGNGDALFTRQRFVIDLRNLENTT